MLAQRETRGGFFRTLSDTKVHPKCDLSPLKHVHMVVNLEVKSIARGQDLKSKMMLLYVHLY